jgi:hypothetical protein
MLVICDKSKFSSLLQSKFEKSQSRLVVVDTSKCHCWFVKKYHVYPISCSVCCAHWRPKNNIIRIINIDKCHCRTVEIFNIMYEYFECKLCSRTCRGCDSIDTVSSISACDFDDCDTEICADCWHYGALRIDANMRIAIKVCRKCASRNE